MKDASVLIATVVVFLAVLSNLFVDYLFRYSIRCVFNILIFGLGSLFCIWGGIEEQIFDNKDMFSSSLLSSLILGTGISILIYMLMLLSNVDSEIEVWKINRGSLRLGMLTVAASLLFTIFIGYFIIKINPYINFGYGFRFYLNNGHLMYCFLIIFIFLLHMVIWIQHSIVTRYKPEYLLPSSK